MRRRPTTISVSLFPFLAVLICAMGALIFLLVVLTRQIREEASRPAIVEVPRVQKSLTVPRPEPATPPAQELTASIPTVVVTIAPPILPPAPDPNIELENQLSVLKNEKAKALSSHKQIQNCVRQLKATTQAAHADLSSIQLELDAANQRLIARKAENQDREQEVLKLKGLLKQAEGSLATAVAAAETAEPKVSIVPYDGRSGTARRPILIECTGESIRFVPEDVSLSASDLEGFHPEFNPLLAGVVALREHWRSVDGPAFPNPYVLLLVHDDGIAAYYAARSLLRSLGGETGYELVTDDLPLAFPEQDPTAKEACQLAVEDFLRTREAALIEVGRGIEKPMFPNGRFEVDPRDHDPIRRSESPFGGARPLPRVAPPSRYPERTEVAATPEDRPTLQPIPTTPRLTARPIGAEAPTANNLASAFATEASEQWQTEKRLQEIRASDRLLNEALSEQWPSFRDRKNSQRGWGTSAPTASISLERPVSIRVFSNRVEIGLQPAIPLGESGLLPNASTQVLEALRAEADSWGKAPGDFYWTPKVEAIVEPGGLRHFERIRDELSSRGLRVVDRIALAPATPNFLELDNAAATP